MELDNKMTHNSSKFDSENMLKQSLESISGERCGVKTIKLLHMLSYFSSQNVPIDIFKVIMNETELETALELLKQFLLIDSSNKGNFINVNKLVQRRIRSHLRQEKKENLVLKEVAELFIHTGKHSENFHLVVDHAICMWLHVCNFDELLQVASALPRYIVMTLIQQSKHKQAALFAWEALKLLRTVLGDSYIEVLRLEFQFASLLEMTGKCKEAIRLLMPLFVRHVTDAELKNGIICCIISVIKKLQEMLQYDEVLPIYETLLSNQNVVEASSEEILNVWYYYALLLMELEKYEDSIEILKEIQQQRKNTLKNENVFLLNLLAENQTDILKTKRNIISVLRRVGKYNEAIKICEELINEYEKVFGENHFEINSIQVELALIYYSQNEYEKAAKVFRSVCSKQNEIPIEDNMQIIKQNFASMALEKTCATDNYQSDCRVLCNSKLKNANIHKNEFDVEHMHALVSGDLTEIYAMIQNGFDINCQDSKGNTLLHYAAKSENLSVIRLLMKCGSIYNAKNRVDKTPSQLAKNEIRTFFDLVCKLFKNVKSENSNEVNKYIKQERCLVNAKDNEGQHLLHWAASKGNIIILKILLEAGANAAYVTHKGNTPLHIATSKGFLRIVEILLQSVKYDELDNFINTQTHGTGATALHVAVKNNYWDIVRILLQYGVNFSIKNNEGKTPLELIDDDTQDNLLKIIHELFQDAEIGNSAIIDKLQKILLTEPQSIFNARNDQGWTLIQVITMNTHKRIMYECLQILKAPYKLKPWKICESKLKQVEELAVSAELHLHFSELYIRMLQSCSECCYGDTNINPWKTVKEGSYLLGNTCDLIRTYQKYYPTVIYDINILQISNVLNELQFEKEYSSEREGSKYYHLLNSSLNRDVINFINLIEINIDIPAMKFLHSVTAQLQSLYSNALIKFIQKENLPDIEKCLKENETIQNVGQIGFTPLHYDRDEQSDEKILKFLLGNGADVTQKLAKGGTLLHLATFKQCKAIVELLLQYTPPHKLNTFINYRNVGGDTPLHIAAINGYTLIFMSLLKHGAIYCIRNRNGKTPLDLTGKLYDNISRMLKTIHQCFQLAENNSFELNKILRSATCEELIAIANVQNNQGYTLLDVIERKCYKPNELLLKYRRSELCQSAIYIKNRNEKIEKAIRTFYTYSGVYDERFQCVLRTYADNIEKDHFPWNMLKEGSLYLNNAFRFVESCKTYSEFESDENLLKITKALEKLGFDPKHIWGYTDKADGRNVQYFISLGSGTSYYMSLNSNLKRVIENFKDFVQLEIHSSVCNFHHYLN